MVRCVTAAHFPPVELYWPPAGRDVYKVARPSPCCVSVASTVSLRGLFPWCADSGETCLTMARDRRTIS